MNHVIAGDATLDTTWQYAYLYNLQKRIKAYFSEGVEWCGKISQEHEIVWYRRFWIKRPDGIPPVIHYLKPCVYNAALFEMNPALAAPGKIFASSDPETGRSLASDPLMNPPVNPIHLDVDRLLPRIVGEKARNEARFALKKVWCELDEFEAYATWSNRWRRPISRTSIFPRKSSRRRSPAVPCSPEALVAGKTGLDAFVEDMGKTFPVLRADGDDLCPQSRSAHVNHLQTASQSVPTL